MKFDAKVNLGKVPLLPARLNAGQQAGLDAAALYVKGNAMKYPPVRKRKVAQYWTPKQRAFFFWAKARGIIVVPYVRGANPRSERLMQRWAVAKRGNTRIVGNNASYAPLVHGRGAAQSAYHKGNWRDIGRIAKDVGPEVRRIIRTHVVGKLKG